MRFGSLTVVGPDTEGSERYRVCRCDCGTEKRVRLDHLRTGKIVSCGCVKARKASERAHILHAASTTHGATGTRAHKIWMSMRQRCNNPNSRFFAYYGGRGIHVCEQWNASFESFLADMGQPAPDQEIDRIDNDRGYEPGNCRWATRQEQQNNRRVNRFVTYQGETHTISEWSRLTGIHRNTLDLRLASGIPLSEVFTPEARKDLSGLALGGAANGARQRARTHCKHGHPFDEINTFLTPQGTRVCRACRNKREKARQRLKRA